MIRPLSLRRPLSFACLIVAALIFILQQLFPTQYADFSALEKHQVTIEGTLAAIDTKKREDQEVVLLTLSRAHCTDTGSDTCSVPRESPSKTDTGLLQTPARFNVLCSLSDAALSDLPPIHSVIQVQGKLYPYKGATNPGEFDQRIYYKSLGLDCSVQNASVTAVVSQGNVYAPAELLYHLRAHLCAVLDQVLSDNDAAIMKAMLLGAKGDLPTGIRKLYKDSGIIHILAISGLHISIIGMGLYGILRKLSLPLPVCCAASSALMLLYGRMTGMSASSFRAIFMFLLHMRARTIHRTYDILTAVSIAAVLLLIQQPLYLYNSGFLFSFGAVLSICILAPAMPGIEKPDIAEGKDINRMKASTEGIGLIHRFSGMLLRHLRLLRTPIAIALATLPIHLQFYGTYPVYSVLLNLLVLPMMSAVMVLGLLVLGLGSLCIPLGIAAGLPLHGILTCYEQLSRLSLAVPGHTFIPGQSSLWQIILYYGLLFLLVIAGRSMPGMGARLLFAGALALLLLRCCPGLNIDVVDVGQGDGIYISFDTTGPAAGTVNAASAQIFGSGFRMMIDGGSTSKSSVGQYQIEPFLCCRGAGVIDLWVITHGDADHTSGLIELLEEDVCPIQIRRIVLPSAEDPSMAGSSIKQIQTLAAAKDIPVTFLSEGDTIRVKDLQLACLHPARNAAYTDPNEYSVTLFATYKDFTALFTGDLEGSGETDLLNDYTTICQANGTALPRGITLLKVAHHGSKGATSARFLQVFHPSLAVISCGQNNRYGHPHQETLDRLQQSGARIYDTRSTGEVRFHTNGHNVTIRPFTPFAHG